MEGSGEKGRMFDEEAACASATFPFALDDAAPCEEDRLALRAFPCILDIGEQLIRFGADVHFTETELSRMGRAYGAQKMNVFVITSLIVASMTLSNGYEHTLTRRIPNGITNDFDHIEHISRLCDEACSKRIPPLELKERLQAICKQPMPLWKLVAGGILSAAAFCMFFGGSWIDASVSAVFAVLLCLSLRYAGPWVPDAVIFNFANSFLCGIGILMMAKLGLPISADMVMIGDIMLLIPGVAMTNATRDLLSNDMVSGMIRLLESFLWAIALALGFMTSIWVGQWM